MPKYNILNDNKGFIPLVVLLAVLSLVGGTTATAVLADNAAPGDTLYGLDQAFEKLRLNTASSEEKKFELKAEFAKERAEEITELEVEGSLTDDAIEDLAASMDDLEGVLTKEELQSMFGDLRKFELKVEDDGSYKIKFKTSNGEDVEIENHMEDTDDDDFDDVDEDMEAEDIDEDEENDDTDDDEDENKNNTTTQSKYKFKVESSNSNSGDDDRDESKKEDSKDDEDDRDEQEDDEDKEDDEDNDDEDDDEDEDKNEDKEDKEDD